MTSISAHKISRHGRIRRLSVFFVASTALIGGAMAFAAWMSNGTGSSQDVTAGTAASLTVNPVTPAISGLVPGGSKVSSFTVTNNNSYKVTLGTVTVSGFTVSGGTGCTSTNAGLSSVVNSAAVGTDVAGGGTPVSSANLTVTVSMSAASDNGCQGATFTPNLSVSGASS
ncbi:hypothetical protein [Aeromicrobium sp.]|uniref:hypothetical protein n=1 Tax=Aeromicrobium sp. TaxID=1871063 RepID=UPI003C4B26E4